MLNTYIGQDSTDWDFFLISKFNRQKKQRYSVIMNQIVHKQ